MATSSRANITRTDDNKKTELLLNHTETDSPLLPVAQLKELNKINPDLVQFVIDETKVNAIHRRNEEVEERKNAERVTRYVFIERILSLVLAALLGVFVILAGCFAIYFDYPYAGSAIIGGTLVSVICAFLYRRYKARHSSN